MAKYNHIALPALLVGAVFLLFGGTTNHGFNSDDYLVVYHALHRSASSFGEALGEFAAPTWGLYYRPLAKIFFEMLGKSFGVWPGGYHLVSLICFALLCLQVYCLGLLLDGRSVVAAAAGIIFMTSTVHAEALFWVSSLNGVVENILSLTSLLCFILWRRKSRLYLYVLSLLFFIAAVFTKESAIVLPAVVIAYDVLLGGSFRWPEAAKRAINSGWPFVVIGILFVGLRFLVMRQAHLPPPLTSFDWRIAVTGLWYSLIMPLSPVDWALALNWFDMLSATGSIFHLVALPALLLIAIAPLYLKKLRLGFLVAWLLAGTAPLMALGLVPSERHVVFGSVGAALLIALALFRLGDWLTGGKSGASVLVGCMLAVAFAAPSLYFLKQRQALWKHASDITARVVKQTLSAYPAPAENTTLFFLNVPDSVHGALVFRFENLQYALRLAYGEESLDVVRVVTLDRVPPSALSRAEAAYFKIAAMGGHIYLPKRGLLDVRLAARWNKLSGMRILKKDERYDQNWNRYRDSPFFHYVEGGLIPLSSRELKKVVRQLHSLT